MSDIQYFATLPGEELAEKLDSKFDQYHENSNRTGMENRWAKSFRFYYGNQVGSGANTFTGGEIHNVGNDGELKAYGTNHYRNLIRHILAITTSQKPTYDPRARNTDLSALQTAKLGRAILDEYMHDKKVFQKCKLAAEQSLVLARAFVSADWDTSLGEPHGVEAVKDDEGNPVVDENGDAVERIKKEGDVQVYIYSPLDVRIDSGVENWDEVKWADVRRFVNKFDLAAKYPKYREEIISASITDELGKTKFSSIQSFEEDSDQIALYTFRHLPTDALPNGRLQVRIDGGTVLYDGPYPYGKKFNLFRIAPGEYFGSTEGYTDAYDVLVLQEVLNILKSTAFTNQQAFGVQNVAVASGSSIDAEEVSTGMNFIKCPSPLSENMPRAVNLTNTPAEIFKNTETTESDMEKLSGVNSVVRGEPDSNLKSGTALARVQAMAIQYSSNFQQSWAELLEDVSSFILHLLRNFADTERLVALSGKHNKGAVMEFTGDDLKDIDRVTVDLGNPLARTVAGKLEIADRLLEKGLIKTPQQYLTVMETGNLDPLTEGPEAELSLIRRENEELMESRGMDAMVGDSHLLHMQEHRTLLSNPIVRQNSEAVSVILAHIQHHMQLYKTQDPVWSAISGEPPAPQPAPPMPPGGPGGPAPEAMQPPPPPQEPAMGNVENPPPGPIPPPPMPAA